MPAEYFAAAAGEPIPLHVLPDVVGLSANFFLEWRIAIEVLTGANQSHDQERGLDQIAAINRATNVYKNAYVQYAYYASGWHYAGEYVAINAF